MVEAATVDRLLETIERRLAPFSTRWHARASWTRKLVHANLERLDEIREYVKVLLPHLRPDRP